MKLIRKAQNALADEYYKIFQTARDFYGSGKLINMVLDEKGYPEVRKGYMRVATGNGPCYGLHGLPEGVPHYILHTGDRLGVVNSEGSMTMVMGGLNASFSTSFTMGDSTYLLDGKRYYRAVWLANINAVAVRIITSDSFGVHIPVTTSEAANLLTPKRMNTFVGDGSTKQFYLDTKDLDLSGHSAKVDGAAVSVSSMNAQTGAITLLSAPAKGAKIAVTFCKTIAGASDKIEKCTICGVHTDSTGSRAFVSGNPNYPATIWYSASDNPRYFPETQEITVGSSSNPIVGLIEADGDFLVMKKNNTQESAIWRITFSGGNISVSALAGNIGTYAARSAASVSGGLLLLTDAGICKLNCNKSANSFTLECVNEQINEELLAEESWQDAAGIIYDSFYLVSVNERAYVVDNRYQLDSGEAVCYIWTNTPANHFLVWNGCLQFDTDDKEVLRMSNAETFEYSGGVCSGYYDKSNTNKKTPISWEWHSVACDFGLQNQSKKMLNANSGMIVKTAANSTYEVLLRTESENVGTAVQTMEQQFVSVNENNFAFGEGETSQFMINADSLVFQSARAIVKGAAAGEKQKLYLVSLHCETQ